MNPILIAAIAAIAIALFGVAAVYGSLAECKAEETVNWSPETCPTRRSCCAKGKPTECWCC